MALLSESVLLRTILRTTKDTTGGDWRIQQETQSPRTREIVAEMSMAGEEVTKGVERAFSRNYL